MAEHQFEAVYLGLRQWKTGKFVKSWLKVQPDGTVDDTVMTDYSYKGKTYGAQVGSVVRFTWTDESHGSYYISGERGPELVYVWHDLSKVAEWQAKDRAVSQARFAAGQEKKRIGKINRDELRPKLEPLRLAYARSSKRERAALLAWIIQEIIG